MSETSDAKHTAADEQPTVATDEQPPAVGTEADGVGVAAVPATVAGLPATAQGHFAVVNANGTLARGFGAVSSTRLALGQYQVVFIQNVASSAFTATIGLTGSVGTSPSGEIAVVGRAGVPAGVFVQTWNSSGVPADRAFHLHVSS
ncbi:hypothetical protein GCM10022225_44670 [Plantactinospora mayteni]|uniref:DUF3224 domain-containing protein n=1 Tax=Plantactinospora mayteni TaxID=566021 RepID=A0ABQ4ERR2_9ACTN|nr:hypothetical protein [Plantactinospora mayteni]GIG97323.1 hypothetical protein Pma05_38960 [Plantactinospora mayteni]